MPMEPDENYSWQAAGRYERSQSASAAGSVGVSGLESRAIASADFQLGFLDVKIGGRH
jgi:hypothetical protein